MLRCSRCSLSYQRGGWSPGSKHQKHMSMNQAPFLYRFAGPRGPGPYTMKYWWTLGCFPTGMETPFRLSEFLSTYQQQHVPAEVEEWLQYFVRVPVQSLSEATETLLSVLERCQTRETPRGYTSHDIALTPLLKPITQFEHQLGVNIPRAGIRAVMSSPQLRERALDDLYEFKLAINENGSTHHRRMARLTLEGGSADADLAPLAQITDTHASASDISPSVGNVVGHVVSPPRSTAPDEKKLIHLLTTFAEGCAAKGQHDEAFNTLCGSLQFAHDAETEAVVHTNAAIAALHDARFTDAEFHGREAALLQSSPSRGNSSKAFQVWATAVAYQDDFERSQQIIQDALVENGSDQELEALGETVRRLQVNPALKGSRAGMAAQQKRGTLHGSGRSFDNEFDWVVFKSKLYPSKMNPSSNEMGSVFRRVGDLGGPISTSRSMEVL